jgi:hypothetical protein
MMAKQIIEMQNAVVHRMVVRQVMSYVAPVIFGLAPGPDAEGELTQNASASILDINGRQLLVTNHHVLEGYEALGNHRRARFQIGNAAPFVPRIIDRDKALDLAIVDAAHLAAAEVAEPGSDIPFWPIRPVKWPAAPVKRGDWICFGGWPQCYRRTSEGERIVTNASWSVSAVEVGEVSDDRFICVLDRSSWCDGFDKIAGGSMTTNLGGLSGCPAFALRDLSFEYVGVLYEYSPGFDTVMFRSTRLVRDDGTLVRA